MTYVFKNLNARTATVRDFKEEYKKQFGEDFFEGYDEEDIPADNEPANRASADVNTWNGVVEMWLDDCDDQIVELD